MYLKRYFVKGLAHASYLFGADGGAAIVDPKRDVDDYLADAEAQGLKIVAIFNSHPHADFASGFPELAARAGARLYTSRFAPVKYARVAARGAQRVKVGSLEVEILETPGHSPDSLSFLVREGGQPVLVFTGDLLFVDDVGRPDLRNADSDPRKLADALYDSLFGKILSLPDGVKVYPAHGAGSLCGRALGSAPFTTVGRQKRRNWAAQIKDRSEFVGRMLKDLPDRPAYFSFAVGVNLRGAPHFGELPPLRPLTVAGLGKAAASGAVVIDTRGPRSFGAGHFPGSLNIGLGSPMFSTWVGFFVPGDSQIVLGLGPAANAAKARLELARIGFDNVLGFIRAGSLSGTRRLPQVKVCDLKAGLKRGGAPLVLDVRTPGEWKESHVGGARHLPLPALPSRLAELPKDRPLAVVCGSGYRSSIAASLLLRAGHTHVANVVGGMAAYSETKCTGMAPADLVFAGQGV